MTARAPYPFPTHRHATVVRHAAAYRLMFDALDVEARCDLRTLVWLMDDVSQDIDEPTKLALLSELGKA